MKWLAGRDSRLAHDPQGLKKAGNGRLAPSIITFSL